MFKKLLISLLIGIVCLFSVAPFLQAKAQSTTWYDQNPFEWYLKVYDKSISPPNEIFGERYTAAQVQWIIYSFMFTPIRLIEGVIGEGIITCAFKQVGTGTLDIGNCTTGVVEAFSNIVKKIIDIFFPGSTMLGNAAPINNRSLLSLVFDTSGRDLSGIKYVSRVLNKFSPVSTIKAQGIGYTGLSWVQKYWAGFRNISYSLLVVVIIVFAFMIMFRVKLNPQTVITVQSALPKVVIAMILITFSYAIAGFAVDLMYVVSGLFALLINIAGFSTDSVPTIFASISGTGLGYNLPVIGGLWILFEMLGYFVMFILSAFWIIISMLAQGINVFGILLGVVFVIIAVWVLVLAIWYTIKVPYVLIKTLVSIYLSIITAPVQILAGTISPSMGFGPWFKRLMADILVFPVVGLFFWFAWATLISSYKMTWVSISSFFSYLGSPITTAVPWTPGIIGVSVGGGGSMAGLIFLAISFSIVVLIPKIPNVLKNIIVGEKFDYGTAMGEATGAAKTAFGYLGGNVLQKGGSYAGASFSARMLERVAASKAPGIIRKPAGTAAKALRSSIAGSRQEEP